MAQLPGSGSCGCFSCRLTSYASTVVDVPADVVWNTVIDIDANPSNISSVKSVERIDGSSKGDEVGAGTRWIETRQCLGNTVAVQTKTVVFVGTHGGFCCHDAKEEPAEVDNAGEGGDSDNDSGEQFFYKGGSAPRECPQHPSWPKSFSLAISYEAPHDGVCNTSTLTVQPYHEGSVDPDSPIKGRQRTLLSGTFAAVPSRLREKILFSLSCCCSNRQASKMFQGEINELAAASERCMVGSAVSSPAEENGSRCMPPVSLSPQA